MSFYIIASRAPFAWNIYYNWIVKAPSMKHAGIRCGWLWWRLEVASYNRGNHLKAVAISSLFSKEQIEAARTGLQSTGLPV